MYDLSPHFGRGGVGGVYTIPPRSRTPLTGCTAPLPYQTCVSEAGFVRTFPPCGAARRRVSPGHPLGFPEHPNKIPAPPRAEPAGLQESKIPACAGIPI